VKHLGLLLCAIPLLAAEDVPGWVRDAAARTVPSYPPKVSVVVLLNEEDVAVNPDGSRVMRERGAIRVLQSTSETVSASRCYDSRNGHIRSFQGWLLPSGAKPVVFGKSAIAERSAASEDMYTERRCQRLNPGAGLAPGGVFAWEIVEEEKTSFTNYVFAFQGDDPVLFSRLSLSLPSAWEVKGTVLNHDPIEPRVDGNTFTWELRDLPWIEMEDHSPGILDAAPRLGISYFPVPSLSRLRSLRDWSAVSAWLSELADPAVEVTEAVRAKAAGLTSGTKTELDKIRAIGAFVQKTNYVAVAIDSNHGGGYIPHPAGLVLVRNYGDCKDKSTLMRALLKAAGIESYFVSIDAFDRLFVRSEWPAPQFNHEIVGIRVSPETNLPAVLDHPRLGRLLFFDPTSTTTPVGDLPSGEQGSRALVLAGPRGELVTIPLLPPTVRRVEDRVDAALQTDGRLSAHISRRYFGQSAARLRYTILHDKPEELKRSFESGLSRGLGGLTIDRIEPADRFDEGQLQLTLDLAVNQFGQTMQGKLLIITPGNLALPAEYTLPAKPRKLPIEIFARSHTDSVTVTVPPQFKVDEIPDPVKLESPYGFYSAKWKVESAKILFEQSVEIKDTLVPASDYGKLREFFENISRGQHSPVVLLKQ
jgi:hypothetical protein